jgi:hypothetical protein
MQRNQATDLAYSGDVEMAGAMQAPAQSQSSA